MSRFKPLHERRPSMWSLAQIEIEVLSLVRTKRATLFYSDMVVDRYLDCDRYRVFIKYCVFSLKVIFLNSASSAAALVFYLPGVCAHTDT